MGRYEPIRVFLKTFMVVNPSLHVVIKEIGKVCVVPEGRYSPLGGIPLKFLAV